MPKLDFVRGFTLVRRDGTEVQYKTGLNDVDPQDENHFMVRGLTAKPGERSQLEGAVDAVQPVPVPSAEQGEVAPVGQEATGEMAVPSGGGAASKPASKADPRTANKQV